MTKLSDMIEVFGVYAYKSALIQFRAENLESWKHREFTVKRDWLAKSFITKLDEEMLAENPITTPNIFLVEDTNPAPDLEIEPSQYDVSDEWELEKWLSLFKTIANKTRTHRYCVVQLYNKAPWWRVFYEREIQKIDYDKNDNPVGCKVQWDKKLVGADQWRFHEENLEFYRNERTNNDGTALLVGYGIPDDDELGECELEDKWDLLMYIRYMQLNIANNAAKTAGFFHWMFGDGIKPDEKQDLLDAADVVGTGSGVGATESQLKKIEAIFPKNPEFTIKAKEDAIKSFAGATRLPLSFFLGERIAGGMNSGMAGYIDEGKVTKVKKYIFSQLAPFYKKLIEMRWGIIIDKIEPYIQAEYDAIELDVAEKSENKENIKEDDENAEIA